jgi:nucleotidyltransferase substrate binding protein (TIGR01987 family)
MTQDVIIFDKLIITPLIKVQKIFEDALKEAKSELERDGAIQRFEYTYELVWKTLKKVLSFNGIEANSPRDVFREAARQGLIDDPAYGLFLLNSSILLFIPTIKIAPKKYFHIFRYLKKNSKK